MKKLLLCMLLLSTTAFAQEPVKTLTCQSSSNDFVSFSAKLDPNAFDVGSGFYGVPEANVAYNYSSAILICIGNEPDAIKCIGYWMGQGDIAEVRTSKNRDGTISATFQTTQAYGHLKVTVPCKIN